MEPKGIGSTRIQIGRPIRFWPFLLMCACLVSPCIGFIFWLVYGNLNSFWWPTVLVAIVFAWLTYSQRGRGNWDLVSFLELSGGKIAFTPGQSAVTTEAAFPPGARLEYHIETGDRYFDGDRGQRLGCSLWVIEPDGTKNLLARDFILMDSNAAASTLKSAAIPFRIVRVYDGPNGQHVETDVTPTVSRSRLQLPVALFVGTSSLWLGALTGFFIRNIGSVIAVGTAAFTVLAISVMYSSVSKRTAFLKLIATLPSFAGGYAFAVVCARYIFRS